MGFKSWIGGLLSTKSNNNPYDDSNFFSQLFNSRKHAGVNVNYTSAMRHNDVYTCIRIKAETLGQLPIRLYRHEGDRKVEIKSGREHRIFTMRPNPYQTWQNLSEQYVTSMESLGHFAAEIRRNRYGNVYEIRPFKHQNNVNAQMDANGEVYYTYSTNDGKGRVTTKTYAFDDILYINQFTLDGYTGISTITQCALAIGTAVAGEEHSAALFENGAMPMGVLSTDESFGDDEEAVQRLRQQWNELHNGSKNSGKTAILEYGLKYTPLTMTAVDAQLLEQRKFSREQIASMFRVPLHMLQAASGMKYSNIEMNNMGFFRDSLMPMATKLEAAISEILPENHFIKFNEEEFTRGDRKALVENVEREWEAGAISFNQMRVKLGYDPIEGYDDTFVIGTNNRIVGKLSDINKMQELAMAALKNPDKGISKESNQGTNGDKVSDPE